MPPTVASATARGIMAMRYATPYANSRNISNKFARSFQYENFLQQWGLAQKKPARLIRAGFKFDANRRLPIGRQVEIIPVGRLAGDHGFIAGPVRLRVSDVGCTERLDVAVGEAVVGES